MFQAIASQAKIWYFVTAVLVPKGGGELPVTNSEAYFYPTKAECTTAHAAFARKANTLNKSSRWSNCFSGNASARWQFDAIEMWREGGKIKTKSRARLFVTRNSCESARGEHIRKSMLKKSNRKYHWNRFCRPIRLAGTNV